LKEKTIAGTEKPKWVLQVEVLNRAIARLPDGDPDKKSLMDLVQKITMDHLKKRLKTEIFRNS
jgi:hypothetical protein